MHTFIAAAEPAGGAAISEIIIATAGATIATATVLLLALGHRSGRIHVLDRLAAHASRIGGLPGWAALPSALSISSLLVALLGMYWDISLHIDVGRDAGPLANPAHYLILIGLFGIFTAGFLAMAMPRERPGPTALSLPGGWHAPLGGVVMCACGAFSLIAFPLDDVWHRLFGQDVTLWGPTHLMLIGGAAMTLTGQAILLVEGYRAKGMDPTSGSSWGPRIRHLSLFGGFLIGMSTFQGEFDFGVPQFRFLFEPVLIMLAAGVTLIGARIWGGPGTALGAAVFFIAVRGLVAIFVGPIFGETTPHFPLYLVEAGLVELVALRMGIDRPLRFGAVAGALIGTVGLAAEWGWSHVWMPLPWPESLLPEAALLGFVTAVAAGLCGAWIGAALRTTPGERTRGTPLVPAAGVVLLAILGYGLLGEPAKNVSAQVSLTEVRSAPQREVTATVRVDPARAADGAEWLTVTAWQGGGLVVDRLKRTGPGQYRTTQPIPVHGEWKSMVRLQSGDSITAVPVFMPRDEAIPAPQVPAEARFERPFVADKDILQRETKGGGAGITAVAYGTVLLIALGLLGLIAWSLRRLASNGAGRTPSRRPATSAGPREPVTAPGA